MLVLSRHVNEKIVFPQYGIEVMVVGVKQNGAIRLGITCPDDVICHRAEIQRKIESQVPNTVTGGAPTPVRFWNASQRLKRNKVVANQQQPDKDKPQTAEEKGGDQQS
jgi:carbon storage regulator CsrA